MPDSGGGQGTVRKYGASFSAYAFRTGMHYTTVAAPSRLLYQMEGQRNSFTAPSGTGKSTQAKLWEQLQGAEIINGDRAALRKEDGVWKAWGLPYAGSSSIFRNENAPVRGIVVLRKGSENVLCRLRPVEAFKWIYSETVVRSWDASFRDTVAELLTDLSLSVPVWMLQCRPDHGAVEILKRELEGE